MLHEISARLAGQQYSMYNVFPTQMRTHLLRGKLADHAETIHLAKSRSGYGRQLTHTIFRGISGVYQSKNTLFF